MGKCIYETFSKEVFGVEVKNLEFGLQASKNSRSRNFVLLYHHPMQDVLSVAMPRTKFITTLNWRT
jgi:hypothetical protein